MRREIKAPRKVKERHALKRDALMQMLMESSPEQIEEWVDENIRNNQDIKEFLKGIAKAAAYLVRKELSGA